MRISKIDNSTYPHIVHDKVEKKGKVVKNKNALKEIIVYPTTEKVY